MASGLITTYLGQGLIADRPTAPDIPTGAVSVWYSTDTDELSVYADGGWHENVLGSGAGDMLGANNLSDVVSASTARSNLGLGTAAVDDRATTAQVQAGTASKVVEPDKLIASAAPQTLTDGATVAWDMSLGYNAKVTIAGNRTLTVSNPVLGMTYCLGVIQDGTGSRAMTWPSSFDWGTTGAPTLTTTASKRDRIALFCTDASTPKFDAFLSGKGFS